MLPWQCAPAVFQRPQRAVAEDCSQRMCPGLLAPGGRCSPLAPQPEEEKTKQQKQFLPNFWGRKGRVHIERQTHFYG